MFLAIRKRLENREEGFTLIELLVVVIIIGILAAIAIPVFLNQRQRAWNTAVESDLKNAAIAQETVFTDTSAYTDNTGGELAAAGFNNSADVTFTKVVPTDGAGNIGYCMVANHVADPVNTLWTLDSATGAPAAGDLCP